jgi:DNA-binding winged helix-turn-helix (wHTH) protein
VQQPATSPQTGAGRYRFAGFELDPAERLLSEGGRRIDLNARYFDALALLVANAGALVDKQRFLDEVWRGVPVTDEALTQCIRSLRKALGDDASRPRFIETVPKHGYRFVADVEASAAERRVRPVPRWREWLAAGGAGTLGASIAGTIGGLAYGLAGASQQVPGGGGALSFLVVMTILTLTVAIVGGAGVAFGIAAAGLAARGSAAASVAGGALGGALVGAAGKLIGIDAFRIVVGRDPGDITGAFEGLLLGAAAGFAAWLASGRRSLRSVVGIAAAAGAGAAALAVAGGGRLMGGSLIELAQRIPGSRLDPERLGALVGGNGFGIAAHHVTAALEGALFAAFLVGAMWLASERRNQR